MFKVSVVLKVWVVLNVLVVLATVVMQQMSETTVRVSVGPSNVVVVTLVAVTVCGGTVTAMALNDVVEYVTVEVRDELING